MNKHNPRIMFATQTQQHAVADWKRRNPELPCNHRVMVEITGVARPGKTRADKHRNIVGA